MLHHSVERNSGCQVKVTIEQKLLLPLRRPVETPKSVYTGCYNHNEPMVETTDQLPHLLQKMVEDIKDPECHYWLYSSYFDVQPPTDRTVTRWCQTPLFLDYDALWNPEFVDDGMLFDVILKNQLPAEKERIKLEYAQISLIKRTHLGELPRSQTDPNVYYQSEADSIIYRKLKKDENED